MNWYKQAKIREYFNIPNEMDIKTAAIWSNIWKGIKRSFESAGNLLMSVFQLSVSPFIILGTLPKFLYSSLILFDDSGDKWSEHESLDIFKGILGIGFGIANLFRSVYQGAEAAIRFGLAAGETTGTILKKMYGLISRVNYPTLKCGASWLDDRNLLPRNRYSQEYRLLC